MIDLAALTVSDIVTAVSGTAVVLATVIQVTPIKVDPWTALAKWVGKQITGDICAKVDKLQTRLDEHIHDDDERYAKDCRTRILRFNDELLQGKRHTKEHFNTVISGDITEYNRYTQDHPAFRNDMTVLA